jgi:hypothetical protein
MEWNRSETIALAKHSCTQCHGAGLLLGRKGVLSPCNCVLRSIFHICYRRFVKCVTQEKHLSRTSQEPHYGRRRPMTWGRKDEEYIADFTLVTRRTLTELEHKLFRYHFLLGADWKLCTRKLGMNRGNFFHALYRIEQKLGLVFRELQPYGLYPLDDYFQGGSRFEPEMAHAAEQNGRMLPEHLRFPPIGRAA